MIAYGGQEKGGGGFQEGKDFCWLKTCANFLKIGAKPVSIAYPLPLASFLALSLSDSGIFEFSLSYIFCFLFFTAVNLWNHLNDAKDDARVGKKDAPFLIEMRKEAMIFSVLFYILSASMLSLSKDRISIPLFLICATLTWVYSDKQFFGKKFQRLKEDYRTEILTYLIVTPSFPAILWTFFAPISTTAVIFSLIFALLYLSGVLLKDLKDITEDKIAGYKTLAVVFSPENLFKISALILISTISLIPLLSFFSLLPARSKFVAILLIPIFYSIFSIKKHNWELSMETLSAIRIYTFCYPTAFVLLSILSLEF
ncbi:MAG: UbiA family prenyltransferase [Archaeoglobaceae archaeon]